MGRNSSFHLLVLMKLSTNQQRIDHSLISGLFFVSHIPNFTFLSMSPGVFLYFKPPFQILPRKIHQLRMLRIAPLGRVLVVKPKERAYVLSGHLLCLGTAGFALESEKRIHSYMYIYIYVCIHIYVYMYYICIWQYIYIEILSYT